MNAYKTDVLDELRLMREKLNHVVSHQSGTNCECDLSVGFLCDICFEKGVLSRAIAEIEKLRRVRS